MDKWCSVSSEDIVTPGDYLEARILAVSGNRLLDEPGLLDELAIRFMASYENQPVGTFIAVHATVETPERTKHYYRRMFDQGGLPTQDFVTWASETFSAWYEECFENIHCVDRNKPHLGDPVYDLLSVNHNPGRETKVRVVQVKATQDNLTGNCNHALTKFERLEKGDFDQELLTRLVLLQELGKLPDGITPRELMYDAGARRYRVTALHEQDRDGLAIMTTYDQKVTGDRERRSLRLARIEEWDTFWRALADKVYALLN